MGITCAVRGLSWQVYSVNELLGKIAKLLAVKKKQRSSENKDEAIQNSFFDKTNRSFFNFCTN